jgi:hypothetical protein|tara:strand:- start:166 stop:723 length:558 start_codon:yes stop_codon:yes gene_type:complete
MKLLVTIFLLLSFPLFAADTNTTVSSTVVTDKAPPTASSPSVVVNNSDVCKTAVAGAVQTQILGISSGITVTDENCERIKLSRSLYASGMKVAAVSLLCQDPRVWDSMAMAGTSCPYMGAIGEEASEGWKANMDMIPEGSLIYAKWNQEIKEMKVKEGVDSDASKLAKFIIAAMVMHSGIVAFFP